MAVFDELVLLYEKYSEREISRVLEIPRGSLYNYIREIYKIPSLRNDSIHNFYRREVYRQLRELGVPTNIAESRRNVSPSIFKTQISSLNNLVADMSGKNVEAQRIRDEISGTIRDYKTLNEKMEYSIRNAIRNKKLNPEQWERYLDELRKKIYGR